MRKISVLNLKGGVAKTTTALNLAAGLARSDKKVLLFDFDPQSNIELSVTLTSSWTAYDFFFEGVALSECINSLGKNFDLIRGDTRVIVADRESPEKLMQRLSQVQGYDYVIFDCSPSMSTMNKIALTYSKEAIIPVSTDYLGYESLQKTMTFINEFADFNDMEIKISKIVPTMFDQRNNICKEILDTINNEHYQIVSMPIRVNSKLKEAPKHKKSIFSYAKNSKGAKDYWSLVQSIISDEHLVNGAYVSKVEEAAVEEEE